MKALIVALLALAIETKASAQRYETTSSLTVSADPSVEDQLSSCVRTGMRKLGDVLLVGEQDKPYFEIRIAAISVHDRTGLDLGVAAAVLILMRPIANSDPEVRYPFSHAIFSDSEQSSICSRITAFIDSQIEIDREAWQRRLRKQNTHEP